MKEKNFFCYTLCKVLEMCQNPTQESEVKKKSSILNHFAEVCGLVKIPNYFWKLPVLGNLSIKHGAQWDLYSAVPLHKIKFAYFNATIAISTSRTSFEKLNSS